MGVLATTSQPKRSPLLAK